MAGNPYDEQEAIRGVLGGDVDAFGLLVERYQRPIYNLMLRATGSPDTAADLAQDTFIRAYESLERFRPGARFFSWIYAIGVNRARDWLRERNRRRETELDDVDLESLMAQVQQSGPPDCLDGKRVLRVLEELSLEHREALLLRYIEDLSMREIAEILNITLSAAKMRVHRALDIVRYKLEAGHV